jgi:nucleotide-binding universal stress UspA family protein
MKWIVGIDPSEGHEGSIQFAAWLKRLGFVAEDQSIEAVHVLPQVGLFAPGMTKDEQAIVHDHAKKHLDEVLQKSLASGAISSLRVLQSETIDVGLGQAQAEAEAEAIAVGRRTPRGESGVVRLGPVARRLLRTLPSTVVVVPPDLGTRGSGQGPVLLATDLEDHSRAAANFAMEMAKRLDRPLAVAHVVPTVSFATTYLSPATLSKLHDETGHIDRLRSWCDAQKIETAGPMVLFGEPVREVAKTAMGHDAALVVVGSRRLSLPARAFAHSFSSELAASSWAPVAVVPDDA